MRRAGLCILLGAVFAIGGGVAMSWARSAACPRAWFDPFDGHLTPRMLANSQPVIVDGYKRMATWQRSIVCDVVELRRPEFFELGRSRNSADVRAAMPGPLPRWAEWAAHGEPERLIQVAAYGWPVRTMRVRGTELLATSEQTTDGAWKFDSIPARGTPAGVAWGVAWRPIWPNVLGGTAFYAAAFWLLLTAAAGTRSWRWRRRGRCGQCGYEGVGRGVCSECGWGAEGAKAG